MKKHFFAGVLCGLLIGFGVGNLPGCTASGTFDTEAIQKGTDDTRAALANTKAQLEAQLVLTTDADKRAEIQKAIGKIDELIVKVESGANLANLLLNPDGSINGPQAGAAISNLLPYPWNLVAAIGVPLLTGLAGYKFGAKKATTAS